MSRHYPPGQALLKTKAETSFPQSNNPKKDALMATAAQIPVSMPIDDFVPLKGADHVEFFVGNARQSSYFYRTALGMKLVAYAGPETGVGDRASYASRKGRCDSS
jgi:hypothetical protein